jgi:hypothetical protein
MRISIEVFSGSCKSNIKGLWHIQIAVILTHFALSVSDNDITDVLDLTFSTDDNQFGEVVSVDLKENGSEIAVTEENKKEYVE